MLLQIKCAGKTLERRKGRRQKVEQGGRGREKEKMSEKEGGRKWRREETKEEEESGREEIRN